MKKGFYFFSFKKEKKGGDEMKSNFQGFNAVSLPDDETPECLYCKEYSEQDDEENVKINGEFAHFSAEFCRLDKIFESCQVGKKTDLKNGQISEKHFKTLLVEREKALHLSTPFNPIDLF